MYKYIKLRIQLFSSLFTVTFSPGYYLYVDSSVGEWGDMSFLISDVFQPSTRGYCLRFWYHMYGDHVGTLRVYINDR